MAANGTNSANHATRHSAARFSAGFVVLLAGAHFVHDVFTSLLAPLLPLLIERLSLSLLQAGSLAVVLQLPSLANPVLGSWVDRGSYHRALVAIGPGFSGSMMCLVGLAPGYAALLVLLLTAGLSVACLHVAAPVVIQRMAGDHVGRGMSYFMVAGELARTLAPLLAVQIVATFGLEGMWRLIPVALGASIILWWQLGRIPSVQSRTRPTHLFQVWGKMRRLLTGVSGILMARAFMAGALGTFLPTFVYGESGSFWTANLSLTLFELSGALGAFMSGTWSDRLGRRVVLLVTVAASPPLTLLFLYTDGPARLVVLTLLGLAMLSTAPVLMAVVLENAGADAAAANGTYFMISFTARSIVLLAVGAMGDAFGLRTAYFWCAGLALLGLPFILLLPPSRPVRS